MYKKGDIVRVINAINDDRIIAPVNGAVGSVLYIDGNYIHVAFDGPVTDVNGSIYGADSVVLVGYLPEELELVESSLEDNETQPDVLL